MGVLLFLIRRLRPSIYCLHRKKNFQEYLAYSKNSLNFSNQNKVFPFYILTLRKDPKIHRNDPKIFHAILSRIEFPTLINRTRPFQGCWDSFQFYYAPNFGKVEVGILVLLFVDKSQSTTLLLTIFLSTFFNSIKVSDFRLFGVGKYPQIL